MTCNSKDCENCINAVLEEKLKPLKEDISLLKQHKADNHDVKPIAEEVRIQGTKIDVISNQMTNHEKRMDQIDASIEKLTVTVEQIKDMQYDTRESINCIKSTLEILKEKYIDKVDDIDKLIRIKVYEETQDLKTETDAGSTLIQSNKFWAVFILCTLTIATLLVLGILKWNDICLMAGIRS